MSESVSPISVTGRVVVITGGAGLLGRRYAATLAKQGAHAVIADVNGEAAEAVAADIAATGAVQPLAVQVDITDKPSVVRMVEEVLRRCDRIDALVNNAAVDPKFDREHRASHQAAFEHYPLEAWNRSLAVNVTGMFLCAQAVAPAMLAARRGVIVNVSSIYGVVGPDQRLYESEGGARTYKPVDYSVTKAAAHGLTRYLAAYWATRGIRVNTLTLGGVFNNHDEGFTARYSFRTPMGRMARPDEYSGALLFLVSDASSYMTGANLVVDGGWTAW